MGLNLDKAAPKGDGAPEVTPEMLKAGLAVLERATDWVSDPADEYPPEFTPSEDTAKEVFLAMWKARPRSRPAYPFLELSWLWRWLGRVRTGNKRPSHPRPV